MKLAHAGGGVAAGSGIGYTSLRSSHGHDRKNNVEQNDSGKMIITVTDFDTRSSIFSKFTRFINLYYCILNIKNKYLML